ncbi:MAG: ABC transporter permease [Sulfolobaceae archaeon]
MILKFFSIISLIILILPILILIYLGLFVYKSPQVLSYTFFSSLILTLVSSSIAMLVNIFLFTPLAYFLSRNNNKLIESIVDLPATIPHPIVGIALVFLTSPYTPIGKVLNSLGISLFDNLLGLVYALVIVSAPIYIKTLKSYFDALPSSYEYFAKSLGTNEIKLLLMIVLPLSIRGLITSALISMARAMSEFGSVAIIAYYILQPPFERVSPVSVIIFDYYTFYGPGPAITASSIMVLVGLAYSYIVRIIEKSR